MDFEEIGNDQQRFRLEEVLPYLNLLEETVRTLLPGHADLTLIDNINVEEKIKLLHSLSMKGIDVWELRQQFSRS